MTKTDILLIPNFIGQKVIFREKMTFCPPPGLQPTSQKLSCHGYDKARTNVMARDINKIKSFEQVF